MSKRKLKHEDSLDSLEGSDSKKVHAGNENLHEIAKQQKILVSFKHFKNEFERAPFWTLEKISRERFLMGQSSGKEQPTLDQLEEKSRLGGYENTDHFIRDLISMVTPNTNDFQDLSSLESHMHNLRRSQILEAQSPYRLLLDSVYQLQDGDARSIWEMFEELPSREEYPEYYKVIKDPIDLRAIDAKIKENRYNSLGEMEKDFNTMVKNAHTFNERGSQIYKDASVIKKTVNNRRVEIEKGLLGAKVSDRIRSRQIGRTISHQSQDSDLDSVTTEDDNQPAEGSRKDDHTITDEESLEVSLYNAVTTHTDNYGRLLCEPFMRLPSKRSYPDYYNVIKKPISLLKIKTKISGHSYNTLDSLEKDLDLVFNNARMYNEATSLLYKDAVTLQTFMKERKKELQKLDSASSKGSKMEENATPSQKKRGRATDVDPKVLKKRLKQMFLTVKNYQDDEGRTLSEIFLELPSEEEYPEYYKVITQPIDMNTIEENINNGKYSTEEAFIHDFDILFANARHFNEEGSQVYLDSIVLEKQLRKKKRSLGALNADGTPKQSPGKKFASSPAASVKRPVVAASPPPIGDSQRLLHHIKKYTDCTGRLLCVIFDKLPSKADYPDYYVLIKKPIDLLKISAKVESGQYTNIDDLEQDLVLMFDNACRYNEPDSQVYKDALTLQREMIRKKAEIIGEATTVIPDVPDFVQKLLRSLYESFIGHKDEEGRCYSDSLLEHQVTPELNEATESPRKPLSLEIIGTLLSKNFYKRLDRLQEDVFTVLEEIRTVSRTDSEMYEDATELQVFFVAQRDILCKDGQIFLSPALNYTKRMLLNQIEDEKKTKQNSEENDDEKAGSDEVKKQSTIDDILISPENELEYVFDIKLGNELYRPGDFVYVRIGKEEPHIVFVEKLWRDKHGNTGMYCCWFYRPEETFHLASRKFLEKELFRSDHYSHISPTKIDGRCHVMSVRDFFKLQPEGFNDDDVFVCESRYHVRTRIFKKIKTWPNSSRVNYIQRTTTPSTKRVASVFANEQSKSMKNEKDISTDFDESNLEEYAVGESQKNIERETSGGEEGYTYYEQYCTATGCYKIGDSVYVRSDEEYPYMAKIDKIWTDKSGAAWFHGNWYLRPEEAKHMPTRMFYEQECFQSNIEDTNPMASIMGLCFIMHMKDYVACRPTEIMERDVYLCQSRYDEGDGTIRKMKVIKRPALSNLVRDYEFYYFASQYVPKKRPSPLLMDRPPTTAVHESFSEENESELSDEARKGLKRVREHAGFALFVNELAILMRRNDPEVPDEELQRVALSEWRTLSGAKKAELEARARAQGLQADDPRDGSLLIYECGWSGCDYQYEDIQDLMIHVMENGGHLGGDNNNFPCNWIDCIRSKRGLPPFPTHSKLARHVREVHFKVAAKRIQPHQKSRNYFPKNQAAESRSIALSHDDQSSTDSFSARGIMTSVSSPFPVPKTSVNRPSSQAGIPFTSALSADLPLQPAMMPFHANAAQQQLLQQQQQQRMMLPRPPIPSTTVGAGVQPGIQPSGMPLHQSLTIEQQQMLLQQVQRQQQQIQKMQLQLQQMATQQQQQQQQQQQKQQTQSDDSPMFVDPPPNTTKVRHSEAYLRYIEGLRDGKQYLSNWSELSDSNSRPNPQGSLPISWLGGQTFGHGNATDALMSLRDHMLRDAITIPYFIFYPASN